MSDRPLLVLGGSRYQIPYIEAGQRLGKRVLCCDMHSDPPGKEAADRFIQCDTSDHEHALAIAKEEQVAGVLAPATDVAVLTKALIDDTLGLAGPPVDAALILTDKSKFRIWRDQIEPGPRWRTVDTWHMPDREPLPTPFILKPNRSSGGRGAGRVGSLSDLQSLWRSWDERTRQGGALAETWLEGNELSLEGFLRDGEFWFALVTSRRTAQVPYVATTGHRWPSGLSAEAEAETIESVAEICRRLGVNDGPVDADIIYTDAPQVLELSPRPGGNCLTHLVSSVLRVDYAEVAVNSALGSRPQGPSPSMRVGAAALDILHAFQPAVLSYDLGAVTAAMSGDGVALLEIDYPSGERVTSFRSGRDRIGAVIATGPTISQAEASIFHTLDCLDWRLEPVFTL